MPRLCRWMGTSVEPDVTHHTVEMEIQIQRDDLLRYLVHDRHHPDGSRVLPIGGPVWNALKFGNGVAGLHPCIGVHTARVVDGMTGVIPHGGSRDAVQTAVFLDHVVPGSR